jgi:hypothetical protein
MRIYAALGVLEYLVPKIHRASQPFNAISTEVEMLWKLPPVKADMFWCGFSGQVLRQRAPALQHRMNRRGLRTEKLARRDSA